MRRGLKLLPRKSAQRATANAAAIGACGVWTWTALDSDSDNKPTHELLRDDSAGAQFTCASGVRRHSLKALVIPYGRVAGKCLYPGARTARVLHGNVVDMTFIGTQGLRDRGALPYTVAVDENMKRATPALTAAASRPSSPTISRAAEPPI